MPHPDYNYRAGVLIGSIGPTTGEQKEGPLSPRQSRDGALLKHTRADIEVWLSHLQEERTGNTGGQGKKSPPTHFITLFNPTMADVEQAIAECRDFLSEFSDRPDWNGGS
ncbi:hypothetical protein, partial [Streptomyces collinus]|uniref:hypothetical protein n=1 Tax=Streptomyces collinus TaxID=42684 RepID=UPI003317E6FD